MILADYESLVQAMDLTEHERELIDDAGIGGCAPVVTGYIRALRKANGNRRVSGTRTHGDFTDGIGKMFGL